jgi:dihydroneopterin aldolase
MGTIKLENIRVYAYHGCLREESIIGSDYRVDLTVKANLTISAQTDDLSDTVDYVLLNSIVIDEMSRPSKLLEHVAQRIIDQVFTRSSLVRKAKVTVSKINPPIGGDVQHVSVTMTKSKKSK